MIFSSSAALVPIRSFAAEETSETAGAGTAKEDLAGLKYDHSLELQYADQFAVDYYEGDYALITIEGGDQFLLVPEGKEAPGRAGRRHYRDPSAIGKYLSGGDFHDGFFSGLWMGSEASAFPEPRRTAGISMKRKRRWRAERFLLPENTTHRIMS